MEKVIDVASSLESLVFRVEYLLTKYKVFECLYKQTGMAIMQTSQGGGQFGSLQNETSWVENDGVLASNNLSQQSEVYSSG